MFFFRFPCGRWLGKGVDDGSTERLLVGEMVPRDYDTDGKFLFQYFLHIFMHFLLCMLSFKFAYCLSVSNVTINFLFINLYVLVY